MKTSTDPRHQKRVRIIKDLFAYSFNSKQQVGDDATQVISHLEKIDEIITQAAPLWPIDKISKTDLAVLRLALYELEFSKNNPPKVVIDEAVELAKEFGGESAAPFVNGVLGTIVKTI